MTELELMRKKLIKTIETMNADHDWEEGSDWTRGYHAGVIGAFDMVLEWIRKKELGDGR